MKIASKTANIIIYVLVVVVLALASFLTIQELGFFEFSHSRVGESEDGVIDFKHVEAPDSPFLGDEEAVFVTSSTTQQEEIIPIEKVLFEYVEVIDGCGPHFEGECLLVRTGPGTDFPVVYRLRNGIVLKVGGMVDREGERWYKIVFDEWLRYPERVNGDWYISSEYVEILLDEGDRTIWENEYSTTSLKTITVDRSEQMLYAFDGNDLFMSTNISTGLELTPTPRGTFSIYKKTPSRYMQGPLPNLVDKQVYDLPGVPWNLYFTQGGAVIHGAYWHDSFGSQYSHGCVNLSPDDAKKLYNWAELGTKVIVQD